MFNMQAVALAIVLVSAPMIALADDVKVAVAKSIIYPGEIITPEAILEETISNRNSTTGTFLSVENAIGKMARRTLLPKQAILASAVDAKRAIAQGSQVKMSLKNGGLSISALGIALQAGSVGDRIIVRNVESGISVNGSVQADATVLVESD